MFVLELNKIQYLLKICFLSKSSAILAAHFYVINDSMCEDNYDYFLSKTPETPRRDVSFTVVRVKERARVSAEGGRAKWCILVNGDWVDLGEEVSSALEVYHRTIATTTTSTTSNNLVALSTYLQFDLRSMSIVAPLYAPLRRVLVPSVGFSLRLAEEAAGREVQVGLTDLAIKVADSPGAVYSVSHKNYLSGKQSQDRILNC